MNKIKHFLLEHLKFITILSLIINLIFLVTFISCFNENKSQSKELTSFQKQSNENKKLEYSRMNGVYVLRKNENVGLNDLIDSRDLSVFNKTKLTNLKFSENLYDFKTSFDQFVSETDSEIVVTIEKINDNSPYLVQYSPSEWLGVKSIEDLARPIVESRNNSEIYNFNVNGIQFSRNYEFYKPGGSIRLIYKTVIRSANNDYLYYCTFSIWENYLDYNDSDLGNMRVDPTKWYMNHPSDKFKKLDAFVKDITEF